MTASDTSRLTAALRWYKRLSAALLYVLVALLGVAADQAVRGKFTVIGKDGKDKVTLGEDGNVEVSGRLKVGEKDVGQSLQDVDRSLKNVDGRFKKLEADMLAATLLLNKLPRDGVVVHAVSGPNNPKDPDFFLSTDKKDRVTIPGMVIPFNKQRDTRVLLYFRTGGFNIPAKFKNAYAAISIGYDNSHMKDAQVGPGMRFEEREGGELIWIGTIPAGNRTIRATWHSPSGQFITIGRENGLRRELIAIELPPSP